MVVSFPSASVDEKKNSPSSRSQLRPHLVAMTTSSRRSLIALPTTGTIFGTVTDSVTSNPIGGAIVKVNGISTTTNANGQYTINGLIPNNYSLEGTANGYEPYSSTDRNLFNHKFTSNVNNSTRLNSYT